MKQNVDGFPPQDWHDILGGREREKRVFSFFFFSCEGKQRLRRRKERRETKKMSFQNKTRSTTLGGPQCRRRLPLLPKRRRRRRLLVAAQMLFQSQSLEEKSSPVPSLPLSWSKSQERTTRVSLVLFLMAFDGVEKRKEGLTVISPFSLSLCSANNHQLCSSARPWSWTSRLERQGCW